MRPGCTIPPLKVVQAALRKTTERLACELANPTQAAPQWSEFEWHTARAVSAMHGVSALLARHLRWEGPAEWQSFLVEQRAHTEKRQQRLQRLLDDLGTQANAAGVPFVALKGAALHSLGFYRCGERPMADLDILVRAADVDRTARLLEGFGFNERAAYWRHRSFAPADESTGSNLGEHADNYIKIELHERIREALPLRKAELSDFIFPVDPRPCLNPYPSNAALMAHLLLHAAGGMVSRSLRLINLHDIALLAARMSAAEWDEIVRLDASGTGPWWALPPLLLTSRYYTEAIPGNVLAALKPSCPTLLRWNTQRRRLSDVSLSFLWIEAFPGIGWSRSVREMAQYIGKRVRPDTEMMSTRRSLASSEPGLAANPWTHLRQHNRILRWVASKPPRPATMYAVRAALEVRI
jgi:Uncharacterised nucleotidyltransferase